LSFRALIAVEYACGTEASAFAVIEEKIRVCDM
jgi:hypothetical protein